MKTLTLATVVAALFATSLAAQSAPGTGFITGWDMDENGSVSFAEVVERRADVFYTFDANEDGVLTADEYVAFDEARAADQENKNAENGGGGGGHGKAAQGMTLGFNDVDGNGEVSREEFAQQNEAWFAILDLNGDGEVTTADFGKQ